MMAPPTSPTRRAHTAAPASKKCGGPCGRRLPASSFSVRRKSKDGLFPLCKECHRVMRGPRGKEGRRARALEKELWVMRETYSDVPALADILSRALEEVRQIAATGAKFDELVAAVRRAVLVNGCRSAEEVIDDSGLSRWTVDRALEKLLADRVVETRDRFCLEDEAGEPGRPIIEYHPVDTPRGEVFTYILDRSRDDHLL